MRRTGRCLCVRRSVLAGAAGEHAALVRAVAEADAEVALAAQAVVGALGVLTAEEVKVFHEELSPKDANQWTMSAGHCRTAPEIRQRYGDTTDNFAVACLAWDAEGAAAPVIRSRLTMHRDCGRKRSDTGLTTGRSVR